jgi:hypothetical protein
LDSINLSLDIRAVSRVVIELEAKCGEIPKAPKIVFVFLGRGLALAFRKRRKRYFEAKKRHGVFNCLSNE